MALTKPHLLPDAGKIFRQLANIKYLPLYILLLILLVLFSPDLAFFAGAFTKTFYEGYSSGKIFALLGWMLLLPLAALLIQRGHFPLPAPFPKIPPAVLLLSVAVAGMLLNIALTFWLISLYGGTIPNSFVGVMIDTPDHQEWEGTYLGHTHAGKVALAPFSALLGGKADLGLPMYSILPFAELFSVIFMLFLLAGAYFALRESLFIIRHSNGTITPQLIIWLLVSFGLLLSMVDGGLFSYTGKIHLGLLVFYLLWYRKSPPASPALALMVPVIAASSVIFLLSIPLFGFPVVPVISMLILLMATTFLIAFTGKVSFPLRAAYTGLFALFFVLVLFSFTYNVAKAVPIAQTSHTFLVYGLNPETTNAEFETAVQKVAEPESISKSGWVGYFSGIVREPYTQYALEQSLKKDLAPRSYFLTVLIPKKTWHFEIRSPENLTPLNQCNSALAQYQVVQIPAGQVAFVTGPLDPSFGALYALNCLFEAGVKQPVVVVSF